ncbi:MAG: succinylglutamate desuccinylase/aspartoacylase family protein [Acidobacteriaceae bacterium]|nr:succinylglutamate desuccinylase/aspartoacylase family protein [Acidobacteriaceae bacterium]
MIRGERPGKTLVVSAAVHGDEYEGVRVILDRFQDLEPAGMSGNFVAIVASNPPAFWAGMRTSPLDDGNLARSFPGSMDGSPTQRLAYWIERSILPLAHLYIDFHSGGLKFAMPSLIGYFEGDEIGREAAFSFGSPVVWQHPTVPPGRTVSAARERGIPAIYTESPGGGRISEEALRAYSLGLENVLRFLGVVSGTPERVDCKVHLHGDGNIESGVTSSTDGILVSRVELLQRVSTGEELGLLYGLNGEVINRVYAPCSGLVVLIHAFPMVRVGEPLFLITGTCSGDLVVSDTGEPTVTWSNRQ